MRKSLCHDCQGDVEKASKYLANLVRKKYDKRKHRNDMEVFAEDFKEQLIQKKSQQRSTAQIWTILPQSGN